MPLKSSVHNLLHAVIWGKRSATQYGLRNDEIAKLVPSFESMESGLKKRWF